MSAVLHDVGDKRKADMRKHRVNLALKVTETTEVTASALDLLYSHVVYMYIVHMVRC